MEKRIFLLGDFVGYGNVALATSRAVLTKLGFAVFCLPTALISNTWNFGSCAALSTTDYLKATIKNWEQLDFQPDAVLIGYLAEEAQAQWVGEQCEKWRRAGAVIFLDPIFADGGKRYRGVGEEQLAHLRQLLPKVDFVLPNATEACFLAQTERAETALQRLACRNVVITGASLGERRAVLLRTPAQTTVFPYTPVPGSFSGAGDAFAALFAGKLLSGLGVGESVQAAMDTTALWIRRSLAEGWQGMGLPVERYFDQPV